MIVYTYRARDNSYATYPIRPGAASVQRGTLIIQGNVWTYPWQQNENGKTTYFRAVNVFKSPDVIEYRQEFSQDQQHWRIAATGHEQRVR